MSISVRRFQPDDVPAIARLNERFAAKEVADRVYPESATTPSEARGDAVSQELFVAVDGNEVRGGVWLHELEFVHTGNVIRAGWVKYPVAESLIDREFGGVPGAMLVSLMRRQRELMALGMGGREMPIARILAALGWTLIDVPFYVAPIRPSRALRHLPAARFKSLARLLSFTGLATAASMPLSARRAATSAGLLRGVSTMPVPEFGPWAQTLWDSIRGRYGFICRRDPARLNPFFNIDYWKLERLRIQREGVDIGWAIVTFPRTGTGGGKLRLGMVADALAAPEDAATVLAAATRYLVDARCELIVTNQLHAAWQAPLKRLGYVRRPSNFVFACSKAMAARIAPLLETGDVYINRGDCDGPPP